jgi:hypothetical protein
MVFRSRWSATQEAFFHALPLLSSGHSLQSIEDEHWHLRATASERLHEVANKGNLCSNWWDITSKTGARHTRYLLVPGANCQKKCLPGIAIIWPLPVFGWPWFCRYRSR